MAEQLGGLALAEHLGSMPRTHVVIQNHSEFPSQGRPSRTTFEHDSKRKQHEEHGVQGVREDACQVAPGGSSEPSEPASPARGGGQGFAK